MTQAAEEQRETEREFLSFLYRQVVPENRDGRAALAALRRGLGKRVGEAPEMFPYLVPLTADLDGWDLEAYYQVAALFALYAPEKLGDAPGSLGASLRQAATGAGGDPNKPAASVQRRFVALLESDREQLRERLRHAVSLCASQQVPINWWRLLHDVRVWLPEQRSSTRSPQYRWARDFWRHASSTNRTAKGE